MLINAEQLRGLVPLRRLPGRNRTKADLLVYRVGGREVAVKDYASRPWVIRHSLGRWLTRRECAAYQAAIGLPGLPRFLGRVGPFALALQWIEARPLAAREVGDVDATCFEHLRAIVDRLHARGIALGDLHHRDVLVDSDGAVWVVDFATAWLLGAKPGRIRRLLFDRFRDADLVAVARLQARFAGGDPAAAAAAVGRAAAAWHRRGRSLKRFWDRLRGHAL